MEEISLSLMFHNEESIKTVHSLLEAFESQMRIRVVLTVLDWKTGHSELTREAIYNRGPDVSEIGSTWTSDLVAMNALRPFSPQDINQIGKPEEFVPAAWRTGNPMGDTHTWSIPYTSDLYMIYYRKDLLQKAGLDENTAFQSHAQIGETVKRLKQSGVEMPFVLPDDHHAMLHSLASWIWAQGGDFCSPDGKQVLFDQPECLAAIKAYFGLVKSLSPQALMEVSQETSIDLFCKGQTALHFHDLPVMSPQTQMPSYVRENWGISPFPKPYFLGGTNLVVWQHSAHVAAAISLVKFLASVASMTKVLIPFHLLPTRLAVMAEPEFMQDPVLNSLAGATAAGRSYPPVRLWGVVEERFIDTLFSIRAAVFSDPQADLDTLVPEKILPLAQKLNIALSQ